MGRKARSSCVETGAEPPATLGAAMPTYEYRCKQLRALFDIVQSMSDDPLTECPECGGELRKVFAPPAISFKGSGFYATDHGKKSKRHGDRRRRARAGEKQPTTGPRRRRTATNGTKESSKPPKKPAASTSDADGSSGSSASDRGPAHRSTDGKQGS